MTAYGRLDAVVTTAQTMAYGTVEQVPAEVLHELVDVAVVGTAHVARAVLPRFREAGGGSLVVVNSLLAEIAVPSMGGYCAAKWGQLGLVRALQVEIADERGIDVSLVLPGAVDTPIYHQAATYAGSRGSAPPPVVSPEAGRRGLRALPRPAAPPRPRRSGQPARGRRLPAGPGDLRPASPRRWSTRSCCAARPGDDAGNVFAPHPRRRGPARRLDARSAGCATG